MGARRSPPGSTTPAQGSRADVRCRNHISRRGRGLRLQLLRLPARYPGGERGDAALIRAKDAAEASNRAKTEFLAKISHDIRTPLNAILGSADLLSQTSLSFDQSEYVNMFQRNCRRLVALINDFLDFSRIEAGAVRVERAPFQIRETVDDAVATFRETAARKGIDARSGNRSRGARVGAGRSACASSKCW